MTTAYTDRLLDRVTAPPAVITRLRELLEAGDALSEAAALFTAPDNLDEMADDCGWLEQRVSTWDSLRNSAVPA